MMRGLMSGMVKASMFRYRGAGKIAVEQSLALPSCGNQAECCK